jgi:1,4-dihydroxy-2-naphthoate octaprenyltransferase
MRNATDAAKQIRSERKSEKIRAWFELSRPPFHTVGILPFLLGSLLAWKVGGMFHTTVFSLGILAIVLIMLSTYHAGEYFDHEEDKISKQEFNSRFAGGSGVIPSGTLSRQVPLWTSIIAFAFAAITGLVLQFVFKTGPYTLLLGCLGAFPGFFYSTKPVRLVEKGIGEAFIGFCYGWLPVAAAFYIQTGYIHPIIHWMGISIGATIINVILLNEYPDYNADFRVGKKNLLVRIGKQRGVLLYCLISALAWIAMLASVSAGVPSKALYAYLPVFVLSVIIIAMLKKNKHDKPKTLEAMCGLNIAVNLGTTITYIYAFY